MGLGVTESSGQEVRNLEHQLLGIVIKGMAERRPHKEGE